MMQNSKLRALSSLLLLIAWSIGSGATAASKATDRAAAGKPQPSSTAPAGGRDVKQARSRACRLRVRSPQGRGSSRFFATRILDLDFHVRLGKKAAGEESVRVEIETPSGHLYQTLTIPFTEAGAPAPSSRAVDGYPRALEVQVAEPVATKGDRTAIEVVGSLPVAGTAIVHSSLYGKWTARTYFDDAVEPCGRPRVFLLRP